MLCLIPLALNPLSKFVNSLTPNVFTSFTPFTFSISVSFGGSTPFQEIVRPTNDREEQQNTSTESSPQTHIPQTLVVGAFLAIFLAQVGVNFLQVLRTGRRQRRQAMELQFPQPIPPQTRPRIRESENHGGIARADGEGIPVGGLGDHAG